MANGQVLGRCAAVVLILALAPAAAQAYIDPGNGAYMVQALFTLIGAAIFYLRHPVRTLKAAWHWAFHRESELSDGSLSGATGSPGDVEAITGSESSSSVANERA